MRCCKMERFRATGIYKWPIWPPRAQPQRAPPQRTPKGHAVFSIPRLFFSTDMRGTFDLSTPKIKLRKKCAPGHNDGPPGQGTDYRASHGSASYRASHGSASSFPYQESAASASTHDLSTPKIELRAPEKTKIDYVVSDPGTSDGGASDTASGASASRESTWSDYGAQAGETHSARAGNNTFHINAPDNTRYEAFEPMNKYATNPHDAGEIAVYSAYRNKLLEERVWTYGAMLRLKRFSLGQSAMGSGPKVSACHLPRGGKENRNFPSMGRPY